MTLKLIGINRAKSLTLLTLLVGAGLTACVTVRDPYPRSRMGVTVFDPQIDLQKPLAAADFSGWHLASGHILVGVIDQYWVVAYDLKANKNKWFFRTPAKVAGPIDILDESVIVSLRDGQLLNLALLDGREVWKTQMESYVARPITADENRIYAVSAGQQLYALKRADGTSDWIYDAGFPNGLVMQRAAAPKLVGSVVLLGLASGSLQAIDQATGRPVWVQDSTEVDSRFHDVMGDIAVKADTAVFARYDGQVTGLRLAGADARPLWDDKLLNITAAKYDGRDVFVVGTSLGEIVAYNIDSGKKIWSVSTGVTVGSFYLTQNVLYATGTNGRVNAIARDNGRIYWNDDVLGRIVSDPFAYQGRIYIPTGYKNIYAYQMKRGDKRLSTKR